MIINKSINELILETSSDSPTPGGGSISALAGSLGAGLSMMVTNLSIGKKFFDEYDCDIKKEFYEKLEELEKLRDELIIIIDEDSKAFDSVMEAFKLPKNTEDEKKERSDAIQKGYIKAMEVPNRCASLCLEILKLQGFLAEYGNPNTITDVGVGALLAYSGLEGALLNVRINLNSIKDEEYRLSMDSEMKNKLEIGKRLKTEILEKVYMGL